MTNNNLAAAPPALTAALTLDDGSQVSVTSGVHVTAPASGGWIMARIPCAEIPSDRAVAAILIRSESEEIPVRLRPPQRVPPCGYLDVPVGW